MPSDKTKSGQGDGEREREREPIEPGADPGPSPVGSDGERETPRAGPDPVKDDQVTARPDPEKPDGKAEKEKPRECLLLSCTARSSSIAVRQTAVESVQPDGERTNFANRCER